MKIFEEQINIDKYISLYNNGISIKRINPLKNQTYKILASSNVDIRIIDRDKNIKNITELESMGNFTKDTTKYSSRFFYMIPLQTIKGTIVGFVFRTVYGKKYHTVTKYINYKKRVPIMFGWYKDFNTYDRNKPIIICEGLKDAIVLKNIYPYVLSNNTSSLGLNASVLRPVTNKYILIYDNDETGRKMSPTDNKILTSRYCLVDSVFTPDGYKDISELYYKDKSTFLLFCNSLKEKIRTFDLV